MKRNNFRILQCALACVFFFTALTPPAKAGTADIEWTGGAGTVDWTNPNNWNLGGVYANNSPGVNYNAIFPGNNDQTTIGVSGPAQISLAGLNSGNAVAIRVLDGSHLTTGSLSGAGNMTVTDSALTLGDAANFTGNIELAGSASLLQLGDGATLNGRIVLDALTAAQTPSAIVGISGTESVTNTGTIYAARGSIFNFAQFTNQGLISSAQAPYFPSSFEIDSYKFDNTNGTVSVGAFAPLTIASPHFLNYDGNALSGGTYTLSGNLILGGAGLTTLGSGTVLDVYQDGAITGNGGVDLLSQVELNQGAFGLHGAGTSLSLSHGELTNAGLLTVDNLAQLTAGVIQNNAGATFIVDVGSNLKANGLLNNGTLEIAGTADFRGGVTDSFASLNALTETLTGGTYALSPTGTMLYDAGSGTHGGAILHIGAGTSLSLARGGQLQYGVTEYDALALLTSNAGSIALTLGDHSFAPVGGTFLNDTTGSLTLTGGATARIYGDLVNSGSIQVTAGSFEANNVANSGVMTVQNDGTGPATATFFGTLTNNSTGDLVVGSGSSPSADTVTATDILNSGDISVALTGLLQATDNFTQTDGSTALAGGVVEATTIDVQGGAVTGYGQLQGDVDNSGGTISPTNGAIEVTGNYTQDAGSTLNEGLGSGDYMFVDGDAHLSGIFKGFDATGGAGFTAGESFDILHFDGNLFGNFTSFDLPTIAGLTFKEDVEAHDIFLDVAVAPTPEPSFMWLGGAVLAGFVGRNRLRRR